MLTINLLDRRACIMCGDLVFKPRTPFCSVSCNKKGSYRKKPEHYKAKAAKWARENPEALVGAWQRHTAKHPNANRQSVLRRRGLTAAQYDQMLSNQKGCCAACGSAIPGGNRKHFDIDHDHATGKVRGLLC